MHVARRFLSRVYRPTFRNRWASTAGPVPIPSYPDTTYTNPEPFGFGGEVHCIRCHEPVDIQGGAFYCLTCDAVVCDACLQRAQIVQHFFNDCAVCEQTR